MIRRAVDYLWPKYKFVAEGGYGCIYRPAAPCKGSAPYQTKTVAKVLSSKSEADVALKASATMAQIDPSNKFTLKVIDHCPVTAAAYGETFNECKNEHVQWAVKKNKALYQIVLPSYEMDMLTAARTYPFEKLFYAYEDCFRGLLEIDHNGYLHTDVKINNIMYDKVNNKTILIDFDTMTKKKEIYAQATRQNYSYPFYPPEWVFVERFLRVRSEQAKAIKQIRAFVKNPPEELYRYQKYKLLYYAEMLNQFDTEYSVKLEDTIDDVIDMDETIEKIYITKEIIPKSVIYGESDDTAFLTYDRICQDPDYLMRCFTHPEHRKILQSMREKNIYEALYDFITCNEPIKATISTFANRFDTYQLGLVLLHTLTENCTSGILKPSGKIAFYSSVLRLIKNMIAFVPHKRYTAAKAYEEYLLIKSGTTNSQRSLKKRSTSVIFKRE